MSHIGLTAMGGARLATVGGKAELTAAGEGEARLVAVGAGKLGSLLLGEMLGDGWKSMDSMGRH